MIFLGVVLLIGGMAVSIGAPSDAREARLLAARGISTAGTITEMDVHDHGRNSSPHAHVEIRFEDEFGLPVEASDVTYCGEPEEIAIGDRIEITYDPEGEASPQFAECEQSQAITIPLVIGIVVLVAGTYCILRGWRAGRWRRRWLGIPIVVVGILFAGTSLQDDCNCQELVYTGGALVLIGAVSLVAPGRREAFSVPPPTP